MRERTDNAVAADTSEATDPSGRGVQRGRDSSDLSGSGSVGSPGGSADGPDGTSGVGGRGDVDGRSGGLSGSGGPRGPGDRDPRDQNGMGGPGGPTVAWTGTSLSAALASAQVEETQPEVPARQSRKPVSPATRAKHTFAATRSVARKLALQALYRWQLNDSPWQDLILEFRDAEDMPNADREYFRELVEGVWASRQSLDERLAELMDRPVVQLDPVEHAVLLMGLFELTAKREVPYRVVINESVGLTKRFGATDGHKFVNAVLDRAARALRPDEK
jgi:N utilization substance protein B